MEEGNLFLIHNLPKIERRLLLTNNRTHVVVGGKDVKLGSDIRHDVFKRCLATGLLRNFFPKLLHDGICGVRELQLAILGIRHHARNVHQRTAAFGVFEDEQCRVTKILLENRSHALRYRAVEFLENGKKFIDDKRLLLAIRGVKLKHVKSDRTLQVCGVEIDDILLALRRHRRKHIGDVGAVRVYHADAVALLNVLHNHIFHQRRLAGARLTDDIEMPQAVIGSDEDVCLRISVGVDAEKRACRRQIERRGGLRCGGLLDLRRKTDVLNREVDESRKLGERKRKLGVGEIFPK